MLKYLTLRFQDLILCVSVISDEAELLNAWRKDLLVFSLKYFKNNTKLLFRCYLPDQHCLILEEGRDYKLTKQ